MRPPYYPLSKSLRQAIELLFEEPAIAYSTLGAVGMVLPATWYQNALSPAPPPSERAQRLCAHLEQYIGQMSAESAELRSEEETKRLRAEATGVLLALREVVRHFPEALKSHEELV